MGTAYPEKSQAIYSAMTGNENSQNDTSSCDNAMEEKNVVLPK